MARISSIDVALGADSRPLMRELTRARTQTRRFSRGVSQDFRRVGQALAAIGGVAAARGIINVTARFEDLQDSLAAVTGGAEEGARAFEFIQNFATSSQFSVEDLTSVFIRLQASGITPTTELLTRFTDAAAVTTDQIGALNAISDLYSRTTAGGLGLEDLNRLADRGLPVFRILQEELGLSRLEISRFGQSAEGASTILRALETGIDEAFGGATADRLDNTSTLISNLGIEFRNLQDDIGSALQDEINTTLEVLTTFTTTLRNFPTLVRVGVQRAIQAVARLAIALGDLPIIGSEDARRRAVTRFADAATEITRLRASLTTAGGDVEIPGVASDAPEQALSIGQQIAQNLRAGYEQNIEGFNLEETLTDGLDAAAQRSRTAFRLQQGIAVAEATQNTLAGATRAFRDYPFPVSAAIAGAVVAAGLAQVAQINSQTIPGRQFGGPVQGGRSFLVGEQGPEIFTPGTTGNISPNGGAGGDFVQQQTLEVNVGLGRNAQATADAVRGGVIQVFDQGRTDNPRRIGRAR